MNDKYIPRDVARRVKRDVLSLVEGEYCNQELIPRILSLIDQHTMDEPALKKRVGKLHNPKKDHRRSSGTTILSDDMLMLAREAENTYVDDLDADTLLDLAFQRLNFFIEYEQYDASTVHQIVKCLLEVCKKKGFFNEVKKRRV